MRVTLEEMDLVTTFLYEEHDRFVEYCGRGGMGESDARKLIERLHDDFKEALDAAFNEERENDRRIRNN